MPGLADHLAAPPAVYPHLPYDAERVPASESLLSVGPANVRLLACTRSWDGQALIVRLQEAVGKKTKAELGVAMSAGRSMPGVAEPPGPTADMKTGSEPERGHVQRVHVPLSFTPFEIKTLRIEPDGRCREVGVIEET